MLKLYLESVGGCIVIYQEGFSQFKKTYFGAIKGKFYPSNKDENGDYLGISIYINDDVYDVSDINNIWVSGNVPTTYSEAQGYLATLFSFYTYTQPGV
jgi:hypothetical protein